MVNLDQPEGYSEPKAVRKLGRQNKYEIKAVLWNPHIVKEDLLASTVSGYGGYEGTIACTVLYLRSYFGVIS